MISGDVLFARYAFPPNELGYCGPDDPSVLLRHAGAGATRVSGISRGSDPEIRRRARLFDGAWVYLELIAAAAGIADPLDARVVEAYWIGNELLDAVDPALFTATLGSRFAGQLVGPAARGWAALSPAQALAHHSFQVFFVYPWTGLLRVRAAVALSVLESCRIRWGTVVGVDGDRVRVLSRPLSWDGSRLALAGERVESVRWAGAEGSLTEAPSPGDVVSCHWDWVCDRLTEPQVGQLASRTEAQLTTIARLT